MASVGLKAGRPSEQRQPVSLSDLKPDTVRLNVDIDKELHKKLKLHAAQRGCSVAEVVRELLQGALSN